ncbi:MAG: site-2 protease family protein [Planctomycetes bacterium]|nr:site-2 protease family protein [Planctomycetota bacterium]
MIALASNFDFQTAMIWLVAFIISSTVHEAAHAFAAKLGGDLTAYRMGQVSLNPLPHIRREPYGMVVLPLISLFLSGGTYCMGYASTPIDAIWAYRNPRKAALMSAAGPIANVLLAAVAFGTIASLGGAHSSSADAAGKIANVFLALNLLLFVFNLIPLPPLDGAGVVRGLLPATRNVFDKLQNLPYANILTFVIAIKVVPLLYYPLMFWVKGLLDHLR